MADQKSIQKEKLIQLLKEFRKNSESKKSAEVLAEFLMDNGVFVFPVPEGTPIYCNGKHFAAHCAGEVHEIKNWYYTPVEIRKDFRDETDYCFDVDDLGKTWFLTPEDAEKSIAENGT